MRQKEFEMIDRRKFLRGTGAIAAASTLGGFAGVVRAQAERPLVLGQSAAFSGAAAQLGQQFYAGAKLYFDQQNAQPGARKVEIKFLDDGYEPDRCVANTRQLIADDVFALFGYIGTPTSVAALPLVVKRRFRSSRPSPALRRCANRCTATCSTCALRTTTKPP